MSSTLLPAAAAAQVAISEIFYDAPGTDAKQEWIEIQNLGTIPLDMTKWKINDGAGHVLNPPPRNGGTGSLVILPGTYAILASDAATFRTAHPAVTVPVIDTSLSLNNDSESIALLNASGTLMVSAGYSGSDGAAGDGNSLQHKGGGWIAAAPTPGSINASIASPGSLAKTPPIPKPPKVAKAPRPAKISAKSPPRAKVSRRGASLPVVPVEVAAADALPERADLQTYSTTSVRQAAAAVPANSLWVWAVACLALVTAGGVMASRYVAKDEWEIEDASGVEE